MTRSLPIHSSLVTGSMILVIAVVSAGCGPEGVELVDVSGIVTLDGAPLPHAHVTFSDADGGGRRGAAASTNQDGFYYLRYSELRDGIEPGKYQVRITTLSPELPGGLAGIKEKVPLQYNKDTTLVVEVSTSGDSQLNFDLASK